MKRIICTVSNDLNYDQRMQRICTSLSSAGHQVTLVGREKRSSRPLHPRAYEQKRFKLWAEKGKLFYIFLNVRIFFYLLARPFDIVCAIDLDTILPCLWAARLMGAKVYYDAHEYFTEVPELVNRPGTKKIWERIEKMTIPKVDRAYTVSPKIAELFQRKYGKDFKVIMNVPDYHYKKSKEKTEKYIIYQGALNLGRGLEALILAMFQVDAKLYLAGEGDLSEELKTSVNKLKLQDKVIFTGYLRPQKLKELTEGATIGINLLENMGLSYFYSLSNKFFDYIHAGIPSVCINFPEYERINKEFAVSILVEDLKAETIAGAINELLHNPMLYQQLHENCIKAQKVYNWQHEEKKLLKIYSKNNTSSKSDG